MSVAASGRAQRTIRVTFPSTTDGSVDGSVDVDVDVDESAVERVERTEPAERAAGSEADMAWAGGGSREAAASAARHRSRISGVYACGACETSVHYSRELRSSYER